MMPFVPLFNCGNYNIHSEYSQGVTRALAEIQEEDIDFVILQSNAYRLVQNSFLLHGYFNYDHLILAQVSRKSGSQYYIGVPGNFYEKEKQVAIMYGFSSFECRREPAEEGDFGYYMIKVEL